MAQLLKHAYENTGEAENLSSVTTLAQVDGVEKKLATDYLQNEPSKTLHRNHRGCGRQYQKTKAFFPLLILQTDHLTLDKIQRRHNSPCKYILIAISVFSNYRYTITLR